MAEELSRMSGRGEFGAEVRPVQRPLGSCESGRFIKQQDQCGLSIGNTQQKRGLNDAEP